MNIGFTTEVISIIVIIIPISITMIMIIVCPVFLCESIGVIALFGNIVKYRDCNVEIIVLSLLR